MPDAALIAALAEEYTRVEALIFVRAGEERLFVGVADPRIVRRRLAQRFPTYEVAYRKVRAEAVTAEAPDPTREVNEILQWRWAGALQEEAGIKVIVRSPDLNDWLQGDLDNEALPFGPLSASLRYRIISRRNRFAALTDGRHLVSVVDRNELALLSAFAELENRLG